MPLAMSENDQHLIAQSVIALLGAATTLLGVVIAVKTLTAQQTRRLVGDPNGRGRRVGMTAEDVTLAANALALADVDAKVNVLRVEVGAVDRRVQAVDAKAVEAAKLAAESARLAAEGAKLAAESHEMVKAHVADDDRRFATLIPEHLHEKAGLPKPKPRTS